MSKIEFIHKNRDGEIECSEMEFEDIEPSNFLTLDEIKEDVHRRVENADIRFLKENSFASASMRIGLGRWIRNSYGLWFEANPHTMVPWNAVPEEEKSTSKHHPDNFSGQVIDSLLSF